MERTKQTMTVKVEDCQVKDNTATVKTEQVVTVSLPVPKHPAKIHKLVLKMKTTDTWTRTGTDWKLLEQRRIKTTLTVDGKTPEELRKSQARAKAGKDTEHKGDKDESAEEPANEKREKSEGGDKGE